MFDNNEASFLHSANVTFANDEFWSRFWSTKFSIFHHGINSFLTSFIVHYLPKITQFATNKVAFFFKRYIFYGSIITTIRIRMHVERNVNGKRLTATIVASGSILHFKSPQLGTLTVSIKRFSNMYI